MAYSAGSAKIDITPPLTIPYVGGLPRHSLFEGVHDELYARAVAITDVTPNKTIIMITVDALGLNNDILGPTRDFTAEVRAAVTSATTVPAANIMVASSHAHSTPETGDVRHLYTDPAKLTWLEGLRDKLAQVAVNAYNARQTVTGKYARGEIEPGSFVKNRDADFYPAGTAPIDTEIGVLTLENAAGTWRTVVVNFACHPVIMQVNPYVSADYPGAAAAWVERNVPGLDVCLFLQGAAGNINPDDDPLWDDQRSAFDAANMPNLAVIRDSFAHNERIGLALGMTVADMSNGLPGKAVTGPIKAFSEKINVASRPLPARGPYQTEFNARTQAVQDAINNGASAEEIVSLRNAAQEYEELLAAIDRGTATIDAEVQGLRFGNVAFMGMPGEPFVEFGLQLKGLSNNNRTITPVGYANDYLGYFMPQALWDAGVWESTLGCQTRMGRDAGVAIYNKAAALVTKLWQNP